MGCWCGSEARIDCTKMIGRKICDPKSNKFDLCAPAGTVCDPTGTQDRCDGNTLIYCDDGFEARADCAALGFAGCKPLTVGSTQLGGQCR